MLSIAEVYKFYSKTPIVGLVSFVLKLLALPYATGLAMLCGVYLQHGFGFFYYFDHQDIADAGFMPLFLVGLLIFLGGFLIYMPLIWFGYSPWKFVRYIGYYQKIAWLVWIIAVFAFSFYLTSKISNPEECEGQPSNALQITFGKSLIMLPSSNDWLIYYDQKHEIIITKERHDGHELGHPSMSSEQWKYCSHRFDWISHILF